MTAKAKSWRESDRKTVKMAVEAGESYQTCDCCGGTLPPYNAWEELRATGRGPDCDGSVSSKGNCRAFDGMM